MFLVSSSMIDCIWSRRYNTKHQKQLKNPYWNSRDSASRWFYCKTLIWNFKYCRKQIGKCFLMVHCQRMNDQSCFAVPRRWLSYWVSSKRLILNLIEKKNYGFWLQLVYFQVFYIFLLKSKIPLVIQISITIIISN